MNTFNQNTNNQLDFSLIDGREEQPKDKEPIFEQKVPVQRQPEVKQEPVVEKVVEKQVVSPKTQSFSLDEPKAAPGGIYNAPKVIHRPGAVKNPQEKPQPVKQQAKQVKDETFTQPAAGGDDWKFWRVVADLNFIKPKFFAPKVGSFVASEPVRETHAPQYQPPQQVQESVPVQQVQAVRFDDKQARKMAKRSRGRSLRWLRVILWILLAISLSWGVYSVYEKFIEGKDLPMIGGVGLVNMTSSSMSPMINQGDLCVVARQNNYAVDSNIAYSSEDNGLVVHRFLGMDNKGQCRAKGIATRTLDKPFEKDKIYGQVMFSIPVIGFLVTPIFNFCFILLMVGCLIICYRWKAKRKRT